MDVVKFGDFYEVTRAGTFPMQLIYIRPAGVSTLVGHYKQKYPHANIKISPVIFGDAESEAGMVEMAKMMQNGEFCGVMLYGKKKGEGQFHHVAPFLIHKNNDEYFVADFESTMVANAIFARGGLKARTLTIIAENYPIFQLDGKSCSVFAFNALKNAFLDEVFLADIRAGKKN